MPDIVFRPGCQSLWKRKSTAGFGVLRDRFRGARHQLLHFAIIVRHVVGVVIQTAAHHVGIPLMAQNNLVGVSARGAQATTRQQGRLSEAYIRSPLSKAPMELRPLRRAACSAV